MIKKVYICNDIDNLKYEVSSDFNNIQFIDCKEEDFDTFLKLHSKSLFSSKYTRCFINVDEYSDKEVALVVDLKTEDVIWGFKSLPKNRKLYKLLEGKSNIEYCSTLERAADKTRFINSLLNKNKIPVQYKDTFLNKMPDSKAIIKSEIDKFSYFLSKTNDSDLLDKSISTYSSSNDLMSFMNSLLDLNPKESYSYAEKISNELNVLVINSVLLKKILSMTYLSLGDTDSAMKYWHYNNYYIRSEVDRAKKIGFGKLIALYMYIDKKLGNIYDDKDLFTRLCEVILYSIRNLNSSNSTL